MPHDYKGNPLSYKIANIEDNTFLADSDADSTRTLHWSSATTIIATPAGD